MAKHERILITGNRGYIANNLTKYLSDRGFLVGGFDKKDGVVAESFCFPKKMDLFAIIHLAAISSIQGCEGDINAVVTNNVIASSNIFGQATDYKIPVVFASSQAAKRPNSSVYAGSKKYAECYAHYFNSYGGRIRILRLSNVYGGERYLEDKHSVVAKFMRARLNGNYITVNGTGEQTRDFVHVEDVCEAIYLSLYNLRDFDDPIDIGSGESLKIIDLAKMTGCEIEFDENLTSIGVMRNEVDLKLAESILGYKPKFKVYEYVGGNSP